MIVRKLWSVLAVLLAAVGFVANLFVAAIVVCLWAGFFMNYSSKPKVVEVVRYVTAADPSLTPKIRASNDVSAPESPPTCSIPPPLSTPSAP